MVLLNHATAHFTIDGVTRVRFASIHREATGETLALLPALRYVVLETSSRGEDQVAAGTGLPRDLLTGFRS